MRILTFLLLISFSACGQQKDVKKYSINPKAKQLNDSAIMVVMQTQDYGNAISLLEQATKIDSNYAMAYSNKLTFQLQLKQFDPALKTAFKLRDLRPTFPEYYVTIGMVYSYKGDSALGNKYFREALSRYNAILDTMNKENKDYDMLLMNKAVILVFAGQQQEGNEILKQLYNKQKDGPLKEMIGMYMNKTKEEILNNFDGQGESTISVTVQ